MINTLRPLTQEQRQAAWQAAQAAVIRAAGGRPNREHFSHTTTTKYPPAVTRLIVTLCLILLLAAFTPSAIRLFVIGSQTFGQAVPNAMAVTAVGLATVLSAEVGQVVFSLALATLGYFSILSPSLARLDGHLHAAGPGWKYTSGPSGSPPKRLRLARSHSAAAHRAFNGLRA